MWASEGALASATSLASTPARTCDVRSGPKKKQNDVTCQDRLSGAPKADLSKEVTFAPEVLKRIPTPEARGYALSLRIMAHLTLFDWTDSTQDSLTKTETHQRRCSTSEEAYRTHSTTTPTSALRGRPNLHTNVQVCRIASSDRRMRGS